MKNCENAPKLANKLAKIIMEIGWQFFCIILEKVIIRIKIIFLKKWLSNNEISFIYIMSQIVFNYVRKDPFIYHFKRKS